MSKYKFERGLMKIIKEADDGLGCFSNTKVQVNYDPETGQVWGDWCIGNEHHVYPAGIMIVGRYAGKLTRADIIADIEEEEAIDAGIANVSADDIYNSLA